MKTQVQISWVGQSTSLSHSFARSDPRLLSFDSVVSGDASGAFFVVGIFGVCGESPNQAALTLKRDPESTSLESGAGLWMLSHAAAAQNHQLWSGRDLLSGVFSVVSLRIRRIWRLALGSVRGAGTVTARLERMWRVRKLLPGALCVAGKSTVAVTKLWIKRLGAIKVNSFSKMAKGQVGQEDIILRRRNTQRLDIIQVKYYSGGITYRWNHLITIIRYLCRRASSCVGWTAAPE